MALIHVDTGHAAYVGGETLPTSNIWVFVWGPLRDQPDWNGPLEFDHVPMYGWEYLVGRY